MPLHARGVSMNQARFVLLSMIAAAILTSCQPRSDVNVPSAIEIKSNVVAVTGYAFNPELAQLDADKQRLSTETEKPEASAPDFSWAKKILRATASAPRPSGFASNETQKMMARRAAVLEGWRALGKEIEEIALPDGKTVGFRAEKDAVIRHELETLIRSAAVVSEKTLDDDSCEVELALSIGLLPDILGLRKDMRLPSEPKPVWTAEMEKERKEQRGSALAAAKSDARRKIMMHIKALQAGPYGSVERAMMVDSNLQQQIQALVDATPAAETRFNNRGGCEVDMKFDLADAQRLALNRGPE